jgi:hypothetical protein
MKGIQTLSDYGLGELLKETGISNIERRTK